MSPEILQVILPLTFLGVCGLVGEILVQGRRDKSAEERLQLSAGRKDGPHSRRKLRRPGSLASLPPTQHLAGAMSKKRDAYSG
jgi:hypothetical protein